MEKEIEHGINEFILMTFNTKKIYDYYKEVLQLNRQIKKKFTAMEFYNCIKNKFYTEFYANKITRNLLAFNGDLTQFERFKDFENRVLNDLAKNG